MTIIIIALVAALAIYAARHAWVEDRNDQEFKRLVRRLYGGE